jgi:hypothetical protein
MSSSSFRGTSSASVSCRRGETGITHDYAENPQSRPACLGASGAPLASPSGGSNPVKRFGGIERVERRRVVAPAGVAMRQQASGEPLLEGDDERWTSPSAILRVLPNTDSYATTASMAGSRANLRL